MVNCLFTEGYFITFQAICAPVQAVLRPKSQSTSAQIKHLNDEVAALNGCCKREDSKIPASRATHPEELTETRLFGMLTFSREGKANSGAGRYTYRRKTEF